MRIRKVWTSLVVALNVVAGAQAGEIGYHYYLPPAWTNVGEGFYGVTTMAVGTNGVLYAGGQFTNAGSVVANSIAQWDGTSWSAMGGGMPYGEFNRWGVKAVAVSPNGIVYAGGPFTNTAAHSGANYIAQWTGTNWAKVGSGISDVAWTLAVATNGDLYASGWFATAGGVTVNYIGKWNGASWSALGSGFTAYDQYAQALATGPNGVLYAAGPFTTVGGVAANRIAKWNGSSWSALGSGIEGSVVSALAVAPNGDLYAGGLFTNAGGVAVANIARWNGSSWSAVGDGLNGFVNALMVDTNGVLYAGGTFTNSGGVGVSRMAKWNGASWSGLDSGLNASCSALAFAPNGSLFAAGGFSMAGGVAAAGIAGWTRAYYETDGVDPDSGSWEGGYSVTIEGPDLGNGSDITHVTLCGFEATEILSQTSSQVVARAGRAFAVDTGDVRVYSESLGETVGSNLFSYTGPGLSVLGTNGSRIANDAAPAKAEGTVFGHLLAGREATHTFSLSNEEGTENTTISGFSISDPVFSVEGMPATIASGTASNFTVKFAPPAAGNFSALLVISNDACSGIYTVRLAGAAYTLSTNVGPSAGGNILTITNGYFGDITNVLVNGVGATILDSGDSWVRIELPGAGGFVGAVDAVVQTSDNGDILMPQVYAYNPAGEIRGDPGVYPALTILTNSWLDGTNGLLMAGSCSNDFSGISVRPAGDVNGDGLDDVLISAPYATRGGMYAAGETYLVYGSSKGFPSSYEVLTNGWLNGTNGIILTGVGTQNYSGYAVDGAGDVNGDGYGDVLIGAYGAFGLRSGTGYAGKTYLIYGGPQLPAQIVLNETWFNGTNGTLFAGSDSMLYVGETLAGIGDANGDGFDDFILGSRNAQGFHSYVVGHTYLIYGSSNRYPANVELTPAWMNGTNGVTFEGLTNTLAVGRSLSAAGDVNKDGYADFMTGSHENQPDGQPGQGGVFLVYGSPTKADALTTLSPAWADGTRGVLLRGATNMSYLGLFLSTGDMNADGFSDLLLSQTLEGVNNMVAVYGRSDLPAALHLTADGFDGTNGARVAVNNITDISVAGDINNDGADDMLIGSRTAAPFGVTEAGAAFLVYGTANGLPAQQTLSVDDLGRTNACAFGGYRAMYGGNLRVGPAGDFNGDGIDDAAVSFATVPVGDHLQAGETAIVFGRQVLLAVDPPSAHRLGGAQVAIHGIHLGNGDDITGVSLCGISVAIVEQSATNVVVIAGESPVAGRGDVVVVSTSFGATTATNAFTYTAAEITLLGTNGAAIAENEEASMDKAGAFSALKAGLTREHVITITNSGLATLNISGWGLAGTDAEQWALSGLPDVLPPGGATNFTITYAPLAGGGHAAQLVITNDSSIQAWRLNLAGTAWVLSAQTGPSSGGNTITITNGRMGAVTNVWVDGIAAEIVDSGDTWVTIVVPANGAPGIKDIVIQTDTGAILLPSAYTYNPAGAIVSVSPSVGRFSGGYDVIIAGENLGDGGDVTNVTLCGVSAASVVSQSATQVVVVAGVSDPGHGDVRVFSASYGETVKTNGFTYGASALQLLGTNDEAIASDEAVSLAKGSDMGYVLAGSSVERTFRIANPSALTLNISGWTTNAAPDGAWSLGALPASLAPGATAVVTVTFSPAAVGSYTGEFQMENDSPVSPFVFNVAGSGYAMSGNSGPLAGGNFITVSNGHFGTITNVIVDGISVTPSASGDDWFTIVMPAMASPGLKDFVIQTTTGDVFVSGAYTVNPAGQIGSITTDNTRWTQVMGLPVAQQYHAGAVHNGALYSIGGSDSVVTYKTNVYSYDGTNWSQVAGLPAGRRQMAAASLNGKLYAIGGQVSGGTAMTNVYEYDGTSWAQVKGLPQSLYDLAAATYDGAIYTVAGMNSGGSSVTNVYRFDGTNWTEVAGLPGGAARSQMGAAVYNGFLYAVGGVSGMSTATNVYRFDGASWSQAWGLPVPKRGMGIGVADGELIVVAGYSGDGVVSTAYRYDGSRWTNSVDLPQTVMLPAFGVLNGQLHVAGGNYGGNQTNTYAYPAVVVDFGVSPVSGSWTGGYPVVISGSNLGSGSDVASVTIGGNPATVQSQSATQIVVVAGAGLNPGLGDVRVFSTGYGETVKSNAFTYVVTGPGLRVLDNAGVEVSTGGAASTARGTRFPLLVSGQSTTNIFAITNNGTEMMSITGFGVSDTAFRVDPGLFTSLMPGQTSRFYIAFAPQTSGDINGTLIITNNSVAANYIINLAGSCIGFSRPSGPSTGGNEITIDNGDLTSVTNVTVGGVPVSVRTNSSSSITITIPTNLPAGPQDVVLESVDGSPLVLSNAYTVNLPGAVGQYVVHPPVWTNVGSGLGFWPYAVKRHDGKLYVGGQFATGGMTNLAVWNGASWSAFGQPNGKVSAMISSGGNLYIGGFFTSVGGVSANYIAMWNGSAWTNLGTGLNGEARAFASDGTNLYAGGDFTFAGGIEAFRVAKWNGSAWSSIGNMGGAVRALAWSDGYLYAGGDFSTAGGIGATNVARWNGTSWANLGRGMNSTVSSLATDGTNLYAGGSFFWAGDQLAYYVAQWNGATWTNMGSGMGQTVAAVQWGNGKLYAGGSFTTAGGGSASYVAQWDGQSWTNLGTGLNNQCTALNHDGANLHAVGGFSIAGGISAANVAQWGSAVTDRPGVEPSSGGWDGGYSVTIYGSNLAGPDDDVTVTLCGVTATVVSVQGSTQLVVTAGASGVAGPGDVRVESETYGVTVKSNGFSYTPSGPSLMVLGTNGAAIASDSSASAAKGTVFPHVLAGTSVTHRFAVTNDGTATVTLTGFGISDSRFEISGLPATLPAGATSNFAVRFVPDIGGEFAAALVISNSGPTAAYAVNLSGSCIAFSASKGPSTGGNEITITNGNLTGVTHVTVGGIPAAVRTNNDHSITIVIPANSTPGAKDVVIGGLPGGDLVLSNAYTVNIPGRIGTPGATAQWTAMNNGLNGRVGAIAKEGTHLIAGGLFSTAEGQPASNLALWNGTSWLPFPGGGTDNSVATILQDGADTYIGGQFTTAGGLAVNCVAKWDGSAWSSLGGGMTAFMMPNVTKLAGSGTNLYACGSFTNAGGVAAGGLAMWDGTAWSPLGNGLYPDMVNDISYAGGYLYACGMFTNSGATSLNRLARWDGSAWENLNPDSLFNPQKIYHDGVHLYAAGFVNAPPYNSLLRRLDDGVWTDIGTGGVSAMTSMGTNLYVGGSFTSMGGAPATNAAVFDGSAWAGLGQGLGNNMLSVDVLFNDGTTVFAGGRFTNAGPDVIQYVAQLVPATSGDSGVTPATGSSVGGTVVTITGENLGDGADVTQVTLCGAPALIVSQSATQVVVTAGPALVAGLGDVSVFSTSFGESVSPNAFTYVGAVEMQWTVVSAHGAPTPASGTHGVEPGTTITNMVTSPDTVGTTQYVCTGWTLAGNGPASGAGTEVVATVTNHATLTWLWTTNYHLNAAAGPGGSIDQAPGWFAKGAAVSIVATADAHYHFTNWTGSVESFANPLELTMNAAVSVTANFEPDRTSGGVPIPWLVDYGFTNDFEEVADEDTDHDGVPNHLEFIADTNPTNPASYFSVAGFETAYGTNYAENVTTNSEPPYDVVTQRVYEVVGSVMRFTASTGRVYDVQYQVNVRATNWPPVPGRTNLTTTTGTLAITNLFDSDPRKFYRLGVRLP